MPGTEQARRDVWSRDATLCAAMVVRGARAVSDEEEEGAEEEEEEGQTRMQ